MCAHFANHFTKSLVPHIPNNPPQVLQHVSTQQQSQNQALVDLLSYLTPPIRHHNLCHAVETFSTMGTSLAVSAADPEEQALKIAVYSQFVVGLYTESLRLCLSQATEAEAEAEWWSERERTPMRLALYLVQTFPERIYRLGCTLASAIQARQLPVQLSTFSPNSIRDILRGAPGLHSPHLATILFPFTRDQPASLITGLWTPAQVVKNGTIFDALSHTLRWISYSITFPYNLAEQECRFKRKQLEKLRDKRAEVLGVLAQMRYILDQMLKHEPHNLDEFLQTLCTALGAEREDLGNQPPLQLTFQNLELRASQHATYMRSQELIRPSRLTLLWPKLVFLPPLAIYAIRSLYTSRVTLAQVANDVLETLEAFFKGWLLEPLKDVVHTIRAGGEEGVIVRQETILADRDSLERMALDIAKDKLHYDNAQLDTLSKQIRLGDFTPVQVIYEDDIRSPLKSAVSGTLLRSVFIRVQKAKVDINQVLLGIDRLLKSQELTFAFVGVAPAIAVVYVAGDVLSRVWRGGRGRGRYGGQRKRAGAWFAMRRIERLLVASPASIDEASQETLSPLTSGLILLSVASLRTFAENFLPAQSRLREGFLEDVEDLENPEMGKMSKLRVVERMWRCWGKVLGWDEMAADHSSGTDLVLKLL
ncbi:NCA2-domain-containing protein [Pluteus cervinus]|uniref:NCA2-domain-containing protein n=1 Tax=Pluteus cervinus TaxID=181527 RepID=A0ACD3BB41_9AGAR|nr:NCA2-domain-containing protein [Pluteus cervinus]